MPRVIWSFSGISDLARIKRFLGSKSPSASARAVSAIRRGLRPLGRYPEIGPLVSGMPTFYREMFIPFGQAGYVVLYQIDGDDVLIVAIRHTLEADY